MRIASALVGILLVFGAAHVSAQEGVEGISATTPDEVTVGEVRLQVTSDYPKILMDGEAWEEHEFLNGGKTVVLHGVVRTQAHVLALTPIYRDLAPVEITLKPEDWKLVPVGKNVKMWRFEGKVTFQKGLKTLPPKEVPQPSPSTIEPPPPMPVPPPVTPTLR